MFRLMCIQVQRVIAHHPVKTDTILEELKEYIIVSDSKGNPLKGEKFYKIHLPLDIQACEFWSVRIFDSQTGLMICTEQKWPSIHKQTKNLENNPDGSLSICFGPAEGEHCNNWLQTLPGKYWKMGLNIYKPIDSLLGNYNLHFKIIETN